MAERLAFYAKDNKVFSQCHEFEWFPGFSISQKRKSIKKLHEQINGRALEISTKSDVELGRKLSAFNLKLNGIALENVFQSSKCFSNGGPFLDLVNMSPKEAKNDERLKMSGVLKSFVYEDQIWELNPKTAFYDYIYIKAVRETLSQEEISMISQYDFFTDIEFNHKKSINTQARTVAIIKVLLDMFGCIPDMESKDELLKFHRMVVKG